MKNNSKLILAIAGIIVASPALANTGAPKLIGNTSIVHSSGYNGYNGQDNEDYSTATPGINGNVKQTNRADELRAMESEIKTGVQKRNANAEALMDAKQAENVNGVNEENGSNNKSGPIVLNAEGDIVNSVNKNNEKQADSSGKNSVSTQQQYIRPPKKPAVVFSSSSSFNTQTINQMESEAAQRDGETYQDFVRASSKK